MEAHSETTGKIKCFIFNCIGERRVHRMLLGKTIYLDLDDYKNCHFIESGLRERGAVRCCYDSPVVMYDFRPFNLSF